MNSKTEIIAALLKAGRPDLANQVAYARPASAAMKVLKAPPTGDDISGYGYEVFFGALLKKRARIGFDEKDWKGMIGLGSFGDLHFALGTNEPSVYLWVNDRTHIVPYKDVKLGTEAALLIIDALKKAEAKV